MSGFQLPFGIKPVNAVPVDYYSGPYISNTIQDAIDQANVAIPQGVRFKTMEVRLLVNGIGLKYWYKDGITNDDLIEFVTPSSFYLQGGTTYSSDTTSNIYRTGAVNIGSNATGSSTAKLYVSSNQPGAFRLEDGTQGLGYLLTSDINGVAGWTSSNSSFYIQGGTTYSFDTTSSIYRTGSLNIGTGTATDGRFVVSSSAGTVSLVVDNNGNVYNNSRGSGNSLFGYRALYSNTSGSSNTALGRLTLYSNTTGSFNTAVGLSSLLYNNGDYNTAVGIASLYNNTSGDMNTSIGAYSLLYNTLGNYNAAMGYNALYNNTTTVSVLGTFSAGNGYTTGTYSDIQLIYATGSTALGYPSATIVVGVGGTISSVTLSTGNKGRGFKDTTTILTAATSSIGNGTGFAIGVSTILSGSTNTSIGHQSLYTNTSGSENVAIGFNSLFSNSTSSKNVAVGRNTLYYNSTGANNTAIGYYSLFNNTTGSDNTALGYQSLYNSAVSSNNTAIGYQSLYSIIGDSSNNTAIGYHAGHYISGVLGVTLSNWSTYIGSYTRGYAYDTTHEVVIGASAVGNGSYSVTLGNDSITKTILKGNIGIGTTLPSTTSKVSIDLGTFSSTRDGISIDGNCGNNPGYTGVRFNLLNTTANASGSIRMYRATGTTYLGMIITSQSRDGISFHTDTTTPTEKMIITAGGNVGIGTASPSTKLHIYATQSGAFRLEDGTQSYSGYVLTSDANGVGTWQGNTQITLNGPTATALATWNNTTIMSNFSATCSITIPDTGLPPNFSFRFMIISGNVSATITFATASLSQILPNTLLTFAQYESGVIDRYGTTQNYYITY